MTACSNQHQQHKLNKMPFWRIYHPPGFYTDDEKLAFASSITNDVYYTIPPFWVDVVFFEAPSNNFYVGGKASEDKFVRVAIDHIARHHAGGNASEEDKVSIKNRIEAAMKSFVADKGVRWEWSVAETPREMWRIDGIDPPPQQSEAFYRWWKEGVASEWQ
jgi:phenylpyruvate tautomerase PptA (4-oxalocrotonate tautomerase family)